jgi:hypothetical protein
VEIGSVLLALLPYPIHLANDGLGPHQDVVPHVIILELSHRVILACGDARAGTVTTVTTDTTNLTAFSCVSHVIHDTLP